MVPATYTKADVRKLFDIVYKRKPEETKEEEFKYFVDKIKTIEENKEPMNIDEINKRFLSYAVEIHFIPEEAEIKKNQIKEFEKAKLDSVTAISEIKDRQQSLLDFCYLTSKEDNLSDIQIQRNAHIYK